jgi:dUTP pyrophosphatase
MEFYYTKSIEQEDLVKFHNSDSGIDLRAMKRIEENDLFVLYDSGISVQPPSGFYFDCIGRSSLFKKGYMLGNCIGVIDSEYRGTIKFYLYKLGHASLLGIGERVAQLILRPLLHATPKLVESLDFSERSNGAFGSTGKL